MLLHRPRYVASLFPLSAAFWWTFEYLNRFVQNWHYLGSGDLSASAYVLQATVPFSTVLPAVIGTAECLSAYPNSVGRVTTLGEIQLVQRSEVGLAAADLFGLCVGRLGAMAKLPVSTRGRTAFAYHRDPTHSRGGDDLCLCRRRRLAGALGRGIVSIDLRLVLGTLECRELGPLGH
ncbi:MAG: hypothetical protein U0361_07680 [Nitrospiraceae bacterium]